MGAVLSRKRNGKCLFDWRAVARTARRCEMSASAEPKIVAWVDGVFYRAPRVREEIRVA